MSVSNQALVRDNSTLANFKAWASAISAFFATAGWVQTSDTGQVNWSTIASVPGSGVYVYEIWKPGDALQTFYVRIEYGTGGASSNTNPRLRVSIGTSTNGAGTLTGFTTSLWLLPGNDPNVTSTSTQWQCYFSGDTGRIAIALWDDDPQSSGGTTAPMMFAIQRSKNSSGADYGTSTTGYVTLLTAGNLGGAQQSLLFGTGPGNLNAQGGSTTNAWNVIHRPGATTDIFAGQIPASPVFPDIGYFDNPMDICMLGCLNDFNDRAQYSILAANMPYGVSHNYICLKGGNLIQLAQPGISNVSLLMRYD